MSSNVGRSTRVALAKHDRSTKWLAEKMKISITRANHIQNVEVTTTTTLDRLAKCFGMRTAEFLELGEEQ